MIVATLIIGRGGGGRGERARRGGKVGEFCFVVEVTSKGAVGRGEGEGKGEKGGGRKAHVHCEVLQSPSPN